MERVAWDYKQSVKELRERFGFDCVFLALVHAASKPFLTWQYAAGNLDNRYQRIALVSGRGIAGMTYKSGEVLVIQNVEREIPPDARTDYPISISERLASLIAVPLWKGDGVQGVLLMAYREPKRITAELFSDVFPALLPRFCDFEVRETSGVEILRSMLTHIRPEPLPVYELLTYHIIKAQEDERRRISREIHDGILQELLGVQMTLRTVKYQTDPEAVAEIVRRVDTGLGRVQNELRGLSVRVRPVVLDDLGLAAAFRSHFDWVERHHGVRVVFQEDIGGERFAMEVETVFYRVCQEAVLNACKYAGRDKVYVTLTRADGQLALKVVDHGVGFSVDSAEVFGSGIGLRSMSERAELVNGEVAIHSEPGKGTTVFLACGLEEKEGKR